MAKTGQGRCHRHKDPIRTVALLMSSKSTRTGNFLRNTPSVSPSSCTSWLTRALAGARNIYTPTIFVALLRQAVRVTGHVFPVKRGKNRHLRADLPSASDPRVGLLLLGFTPRSKPDQPTPRRRLVSYVPGGPMNTKRRYPRSRGLLGGRG